MEIKQQLKLSQQLVMTPQLQQAIRLLQLSRLELIEEIRKECDANPVLADEEFEPRPRNAADGAAEPIGTTREQGELRIDRLDDGTRTPDLTIEELAQEAALDPEDAPDVLRMMQEMDPVGVCSRDLRECLLVQAEVFGYDDLEITIIDKHLHNLEKHNYQAIARDLKVAVEEIYECVKEIQKLE